VFVLAMFKLNHFTILLAQNIIKAQKLQNLRILRFLLNVVQRNMYLY